MKRKWLLGSLSGLALIAAAGCGDNLENAAENENERNDNSAANEGGNEESYVDGDGELVVYSARNETFVQELLNKFEADTGIEVNALHGAEPLQLEEEAGNVQADVFISNDLGGLEYLNQQGLLRSHDSDNIDTIDEQYRAEDNEWIALSARARGFIYNKDMVDEEDVPSSMEDLFDEEWADVENGYAITRGGNGGMIGNVSALRYEWGDDRTEDWIDSIQENAAGIFEGHSDIRRAVGAGEHAFGLVNNYYYHQQLEEPDDNNVGFVYPDQEEDEMGAIANAAGFGLVNDGPNSENAEIFFEWVLEEENQLEFVGESLEVPINTDLEPPYEEAVPFDELHVQDMPLRELGNYFEDTRELIEDAGLDLELR
ncbi:extracellular solute-binding protein [Salisediminibacterium halotolerans]|uniref:extracellular solute-binding protein n=1 Tax=Salisediminibacterium halotolerans TaxID=517425 RepID=UPI000EB48E0A|nr:extracellular solute-binding protein [Salisediminibacterium halotolerans]RLJ73290.1 iron(III) transport system substrate-binding protein [Actinophytocola xinjiangensis]RPE86712.1 iron(III) transport system substrate-binding protein [Salisediminibacterium halotolerans]TWG34087.1 iron(III) transport system substrate-binding protein [Salisediminibacterium halotolerans]GEL07601.1 iron ABC transporter substrate-binding protein [Salisediminibacterium halotolerans]